MIGEKAVDEATRRFFIVRDDGKSGQYPIVHAPSSLASLVCTGSSRKNARASHFTTRRILVPNVVHRFEESIAGRPYLIEVAAVSQDRWRACLVCVPGASTALMPFYGRTPNEAAGLLTAWLSRAHRRPIPTSAG